MMFQCVGFAAVIFLAINLQLGSSYRILCVFPAPSISHQVVYRGLTLALNKRGHELVVVTTDLINDPTIANYTEIDISFGYKDVLNDIKYIETRGILRWLDWLKIIQKKILNFMDQILDHPDLKKLYAPDSNEKFDLFIVEMMLWQSVYPLATRFDVPVIGVSSLGLNLNNVYSIGNPILSTESARWELETDLCDQPSFWHRMKNFITLWKRVYWYRTEYIPSHREIAKKYFGNNIPADLNDYEKNVSLVFVNQQLPISYAGARVPNVVDIGGFHVSKGETNLPEDLQRFLDTATEGFIYMSLGSNAKSIMMPKNTLNAFITAFSRLRYKVLWKFEDDTLPGKPDNVHIMKWVPQQAVLAHPNLKVFIYQGGVQSTEEAVHHAVPLIGFPVLFDQDMQVNKMVSLGVAKKLEISAVDANELFEAITSVASNTDYKQKMLNLRSLMNDKPYDPLENAVWWTEYVIRHRGAPHLHSSTADEPWYIRQDMDIVAFISATFVIILGLILVMSYRLIGSICCKLSAGSSNIKKTN